MLSEKNKTSKVNQYIKSDNTLYIIYADLEFLIKKIHGCGNNLEKASTTKIAKHIPFGYSMPTIWG